MSWNVMPKTIEFNADIYELNAAPVKTVVMGVGNSLELADSLGPLIVEEAQKIIESEYSGLIKFINGGTSPESYTSKIKKEKPSQIIIIDSANFGGSPYEMRLIPPEKIAGLKFSGHNLPLTLLCKYLKHETGADIFIIGIQIPGRAVEAEILAEMARAAVKFNGLIYGFFK